MFAVFNVRLHTRAYAEGKKVPMIMDTHIYTPPQRKMIIVQEHIVMEVEKIATTINSNKTVLKCKLHGKQDVGDMEKLGWKRAY